MTQDKLAAVTDRYFSHGEQADGSGRMPDGFDQEDYAARWKALGDRIGRALPLDPPRPRHRALSTSGSRC